MAVIGVAEIWDGRNAALDDAGERTYSRHFRVLTDSMLTGPIDVGNAPGIPRRFDFYADYGGGIDTAAFAKTIKVDQTEDPFTWLVHVEYASRLIKPEFGSEEPLERPAEIEWGESKFTRPLEKDIVSGNAIVNTAGDPFDPVPEAERSRLTLKITRNEATYNPLIALAYGHTTNRYPWFGFGRGVAKCLSIIGKRVYEKGLYYWSVTYSFEFELDGWTLLVLNQGYRELKDGKRVRIFEDGMLVSTPSLLDLEGKRLPRDGEPTWVSVESMREQNFNLLLLP